MKKVLLLVLSIFLVLHTNAQTIRKRIADKNYNKFHYAYALPYYLEILQKDTANIEVLEKVATCYRKINDSKNAELWYSKLLKAGDKTPVNKLYYAEALAKNKKYTDSKAWYQKYAAEITSDSRGGSFSNAYGKLDQFYIDTTSYLIKTVPFNSNQLDFSPMYYGKGIVFCSNREKFSPVKNIFAWDVTKYLDLYYVNSDSSIARKLPGSINTRFHEGPIAFNRTQDTAIFTRTNYYNGRIGKSTEGTHKLKLYSACKKNGEWVEIENLPFNNDQYSIGHPAFSSDYKKLYFVSDMPGGYGGTDLYVVDYNGGKWGTPVNMGKSINSEGNEMFPFVDAKNNLYFASNGLPGLGGLDIFFAGYNSSTGTFNKPVNMGFPLNTNTDDFGFIINNELTEGYFTSDRGTNGDDDIYKFEKINPNRDLFFYVYDAKTNKPIQSASISILKNEVVSSKQLSDTTGNLLTSYPKNMGLKVITQKEGYIPDTLAITAVDLTKLSRVSIPLQKAVVIITFAGNVFSEQEKKPVQNATAILSDTLGNILMTASSDQNGNFSFNLDPGKNYIVDVKKANSGNKKCNSGHSLVNTAGIVSSQVIAINYSIFCVGDIIKIDNIYYDFDKYNIRADAAIELDKLVTIMNNYPSMKIEMRSHTDCRGSSEYNRVLSDNRAKSAMAYLVSKGINAKRMIAKGYGESVLVNKCADGVQCTEEEHQANRRTEFKILSIDSVSSGTIIPSVDTTSGGFHGNYNGVKPTNSNVTITEEEKRLMMENTNKAMNAPAQIAPLITAPVQTAPVNTTPVQTAPNQTTSPDKKQEAVVPSNNHPTTPVQTNATDKKPDVVTPTNDHPTTVAQTTSPDKKQEAVVPSNDHPTTPVQNIATDKKQDDIVPTNDHLTTVVQTTSPDKKQEAVVPSIDHPTTPVQNIATNKKQDVVAPTNDRPTTIAQTTFPNNNQEAVVPSNDHPTTSVQTIATDKKQETVVPSNNHPTTPAQTITTDKKQAIVAPTNDRPTIVAQTTSSEKKQDLVTPSNNQPTAVVQSTTPQKKSNFILPASATSANTRNYIFNPYFTSVSSEPQWLARPGHPLWEIKELVAYMGYVSFAKDKQPVWKAIVNLTDSVGNLLSVASTFKSGYFTYYLKPDRHYILQVLADSTGNCSTDTMHISTMGVKSLDTLRVNILLYCVGDSIYEKFKIHTNASNSQNINYVSTNASTSAATNTSVSTSSKYYIVQGSYKTSDEASIAVNKLKANGYNSEIIGLNPFGYIRVSYNSYDNIDDAQKELVIIKKVQKDAWILKKQID